MKIVQGIQPGRPCVLALGTFDGIHRGHAALLTETLRRAKETQTEAAMCTFDRIPAAVLQPEKPIGMLMTTDERLHELERLGFDTVYLMHFDRETAAVTAEEFLLSLIEKIRPVCLVAGYDYRFGRNGLGTPEMLEQYGKQYGFSVSIVPPVEMNGIRISSTGIRHELAAGNIRAANEQLGYDYSLTGTVVHGKGMGKSLGFPTANIDVPAEKQLPAYGVYACELNWETQTARAVVNIGLQPTIPSGRVTVEAFIPGVEVDLLGREVRLNLKDRIREEKKFDSIDQLKEQIAKDIKTAGEL